MERKVEAMVTQQFLFLMSNVVSKRWSSRTTADKITAIKVSRDVCYDRSVLCIDRYTDFVSLVVLSFVFLGLYRLSNFQRLVWAFSFFFSRTINVFRFFSPASPHVRMPQKEKNLVSFYFPEDPPLRSSIYLTQQHTSIQIVSFVLFFSFSFSCFFIQFIFFAPFPLPTSSRDSDRGSHSCLSLPPPPPHYGTVLSLIHI